MDRIGSHSLERFPTRSCAASSGGLGSTALKENTASFRILPVSAGSIALRCRCRTMHDPEAKVVLRCFLGLRRRSVVSPGPIPDLPWLRGRGGRRTAGSRIASIFRSVNRAFVSDRGAAACRYLVTLAPPTRGASDTAVSLNQRQLRSADFYRLGIRPGLIQDIGRSVLRSGFLLLKVFTLLDADGRPGRRDAGF